MNELPTQFGRDRSHGRDQGGRGFRGRGQHRDGGAGRSIAGRGSGHRGGGQRGRGRGRGRGRPHLAQRRHPFESNDHIEEIGLPPSSSSSNNDTPTVTIAVEGCCHGQLDAIYSRIHKHEHDSGQTVDLLLCCGDFQSLRNLADFHSLAVPPKYRALGDFHAYYSGAKQAPILTIFVGGNHEASQALQELPYGGWVAPNIYYVGWAGVVNFAGLRIGGISGIFKSHDYCKGHYEVPPFDRDSLRSVYHVRNVDVYRMLCLEALDQQQMDVVISHDWPLGIELHGDTERLLRTKPFFRQEVERNELGSPPNRDILNHLKPRFWFSAHLHVKFHATVKHGGDGVKSSTNEPSNTVLVPSQIIASKSGGGPREEEEEQQQQGGLAQGTTTKFIAAESVDPCQGPDLSEQMTRFLSLDKCLPRRPYLSIVHIPVKKRPAVPQLEYDLEWLSIITKTHNLTRANPGRVTVPEMPLHVTAEELEFVRNRIGPSLAIPADFEPTVPPHLGPVSPLPHRLPPSLPRKGNPQTDRFLDMLGLSHITTIPCQSIANKDEIVSVCLEDENEIDIDLDGDAEGDGEDGQSNMLADHADLKRPRVGSK